MMGSQIRLSAFMSAIKVLPYSLSLSLSPSFNFFPLHFDVVCVTVLFKVFFSRDIVFFFLPFFLLVSVLCNLCMKRPWEMFLHFSPLKKELLS